MKEKVLLSHVIIIVTIAASLIRSLDFFVTPEKADVSGAGSRIIIIIIIKIIIIMIIIIIIIIKIIIIVIIGIYIAPFPFIKCSKVLHVVIV